MNKNVDEMNHMIQTRQIKLLHPVPITSNYKFSLKGDKVFIWGSDNWEIIGFKRY